MATISFNKNSQGTIATISGNVTRSTTKILNNYIQRRNLDVQNTTIKEQFGIKPSYQQ